MESVQQKIFQMEQAIHNKNYESLKKAVHTVKSQVMDIKSVQLQGLARQLETLSIQRNLEDACETLKQFKEEFIVIAAKVESGLEWSIPSGTLARFKYF